jgi:hypothetical protein
MGFDSPIYYIKSNNSKKLDEFLKYVYKPEFIEDVKNELERAVVSR